MWINSFCLIRKNVDWSFGSGEYPCFTGSGRRDRVFRMNMETESLSHEGRQTESGQQQTAWYSLYETDSRGWYCLSQQFFILSFENFCRCHQLGVLYICIPPVQGTFLIFPVPLEQAEWAAHSEQLMPMLDSIIWTHKQKCQGPTLWEKNPFLLASYNPVIKSLTLKVQANTFPHWWLLHPSCGQAQARPEFSLLMLGQTFNRCVHIPHFACGSWI